MHKHHVVGRAAPVARLPGSVGLRRRYTPRCSDEESTCLDMKLSITVTAGANRMLVARVENRLICIESQLIGVATLDN